MELETQASTVAGTRVYRWADKFRATIEFNEGVTRPEQDAIHKAIMESSETRNKLDALERRFAFLQDEAAGMMRTIEGMERIQAEAALAKAYADEAQTAKKHMLRVVDERDRLELQVAGLQMANDALKQEVEALCFRTQASAEEQVEYARMKQENVKLVEVLQEIAECKGRFSRDPLTNADNCIEDMKALAVAAIIPHASTK